MYGKIHPGEVGMVWNGNMVLGMKVEAGLRR